MAAGDDPKEPRITDALKKLFATGVSGALLSEEVLRTYLADLKLPKDILQMVLAGAQKSKEDLTNRVAKEILGIIEKVDIVKEVSRFAETHKFKISAEIEVTKKDS